jgi:hypothetical protein
MLRWAFRGTKSVARPKPFGALIFDNRLNDEGAPDGRMVCPNWDMPEVNCKSNGRGRTSAGHAKCQRQK